MLSLGGGATKVYLAAGPTDLRKSFDSLSALVAGQLGADPCSGHLFAFCNRRRDRLKVLYWDRTGLWVLAKRHAPQCAVRFGGGGALPVPPAVR